MIRVTTIAVMVFVMAVTVQAQSAPTRQTPAADYRIGANDVLTITVRNEKDLSGDVVVRADGKIALPVGKEIMALGLRPDELKAKVIDELSKFFKPVPEITIQVKQINSIASATSASGVVPTSPPMLEVSGPTYRANGEIGGAMVGRPLTLNQPMELYQASGKTLCASASATSGKPTDAGSGWRLTILPLKFGTEVLLSVSWQRLWERGETLTNGPKGSAVVALQPGERIMLDYISAGDLGPNQGVGCSAVGMGLQIGIPPVESQMFVETSLWLVRTLADGGERVRQQTVRTRAGTTAEFVFDDETIVLGAPKPGAGGVAQPAERQVRTSGRLRPIGASDGKVSMEVTIAQSLVERPGSVDRMTGGSATFELSAGPEEVVAFRVPQVADEAGRLGERMSVRIQVKAINKPSAALAQSSPTTAGRTDSAFITGEVRKPGSYPWVKGMTVMRLVALAGGLPPSADRSVMIISATLKDAKGQPLTYAVDFDDLMQGKNLAKNLVELRPGDTVVVRRAKGLTADELRAKLLAELKK